MRVAAAFAAAVACCAPALADVRTHDTTSAVSMPYTPWELRFPGEGWRLELQRRAPDGGQFYYLFTNLKRRLIASFYLEPAYKCESGEVCRARFWTNPGPGYANRANERFFASGPFAVVEFTTQAADLAQQHWSAHTVHDGVWIDMHLSRTGRDLGDYAAFNAFAQELELAQKAACPECVATKGLARQQSSVLFGKVRAGDATALEVLKQRAEAGDAEAQYMMARLHSWGSPLVQSDERQAVAWVRKAADQGHAEAQSNLAFFHVSGRGLDAKDAQQALAWWTRAADQGFAPAQHSLASLYSTDAGLKDDAKALQWTRRAAEQGLAAAQLNLGAAYGRGVGVERDLTRALEWYRKAAQQGNEQALVNMAAVFSIAGARDPKYVRSALAVLGDPLLLSNKRAQDLRAKICSEHPALCAAPAKPAP